MKYILTVVLFLLAVGETQSENLSPQDFSAGYYLEVSKTGAMYALQLPEDVYKTTTGVGLEDIRIFNKAGEVVPHVFRPVKTDEKTVRKQNQVPFFPLYANEHPEVHSDLSLRVIRNTAGTIISVESDATPESDPPAVTGYLLDLSEMTSKAGMLELGWQKNVESSFYTISVQQSNDLVHWTSLVQEATLADLQYGGQRVEKRMVTMPYSSQNYLKIKWKNTERSFLLTKVTSHTQIIESRKKHYWVSLASGIVSETGKEMLIDFVSEYHLPVSSVQLSFPETNSIARVAVQSRADQDSAWRRRCERVFYSLQIKDSDIRNEQCSFRENSDTMWRLVVKQNGAGIRAGARLPTLELGWRPDELLFVGRGQAPYLLAFGSGKLEHQVKSTESDMILQALNFESSSQVVGSVKIGKKIILGGDDAMKAPPVPLQWKTWLLWAVLLLGVGLLAYMARSLMKEIKTAEEKKVSEKK